MGNSNRESFKLLDVSESDSDLETGFIVTQQRKKKLTRRRGGVTSPRLRGDRNSSSSRCRCTPVLAFILGIAFLICWLVTLSWLAAVLRGELVRLDQNVRKAVAGSQGVPDALQKCHSMTRELQGNQTELYKKIDNLTLQLKHYSDQLTSAQGGLEAVQSRLKAAPELESIPQATKDLANSVAKFGSQLQDLSNTVEGLKTQTTDQHQIVQTISSNITALQVFVKKLENMTNISNPGLDAASQQQQGELKTQLSQLISNVTHINDTLSAQLKFTNDDQKADHKKLGALEETDQNVTSRLSTLEEKSKLSPTVPQDVLDHFKEITEQLSSGKTIQQDLSTRLVHLEEEYENVFKQMNTLADNIRSSGQQPPTLQEISSPAPTEAVRGSSSDTVESPKESAPFHK